MDDFQTSPPTRLARQAQLVAEGFTITNVTKSRNVYTIWARCDGVAP